MSLTKDDLKQELNDFESRLDKKFASKQDLGAVESELADLKLELKAFESRVDTKFPTKQDLADVKVELVGVMTSLADDLKRHFDFTVEQIRSDKNDGVEIQLDDHEKRLQKLERRN